MVRTGVVKPVVVHVSAVRFGVAELDVVGLGEGVVGSKYVSKINFLYLKALLWLTYFQLTV